MESIEAISADVVRNDVLPDKQQRSATLDLLHDVTCLNRPLRNEVVSRVNWTDVFAQAGHHSLLPLLSHRLLQDRQIAIPFAIRSRLKNEFDRNLVRSIRLLNETVRITLALGQDGILAMPYKGPVMSEQLWGSFALRDCADLDILVHRDAAVQAGDAVRGLGYEPVSPVASWLRPRLVRNASEEQFRHRDSGILLELQWAPAPAALALKFDERLCWPCQELVVAGHCLVNVPSYTGLFGMLAVHGWKHNWSKWIWAADIACLMERSDIDWAVLLESSERDGWRRILLLAIEMAVCNYEVSEPSIVRGLIDARIKSLARKLTHYLRAGETLGYRDWHRYMLQARDSVTDAARQLARFATTPGLAEYDTFQLSRSNAAGYRALRLARVLKLWPGKSMA